jgi:acyl carrier protein
VKETDEMETAADGAPGHPRADTADPVQRAVLEAFGQVLRVDAADPDVPFGALGGDSMRAVRVLSRLWRELGVELPVHALGQATTAAELADAARALRAGTPGPAAPGDLAGPAS